MISDALSGLTRLPGSQPRVAAEAASGLASASASVAPPGASPPVSDGIFSDERLVDVYNVTDARGRLVPGGGAIFGYADPGQEISEHRASFALRHALHWLYATPAGSVLRSELLLAAALLASRVTTRTAPDAREARQWDICRHEMRQTQVRSAWDLELAQCVGTLLRERTADRRLLIDPEQAQLWRRAGTIAALFLKFKPFPVYAGSMRDERAVPVAAAVDSHAFWEVESINKAIMESEMNDQAVPNVTDLRAVAREVIDAIVGCATHEELRARVSELRQKYVSVQEVANELRLAERVVDHGWALAERVSAVGAREQANR